MRPNSPAFRIPSTYLAQYPFLRFARFVFPLKWVLPGTSWSEPLLVGRNLFAISMTSWIAGRGQSSAWHGSCHHQAAEHDNQWLWPCWWLKSAPIHLTCLHAGPSFSLIMYCYVIFSGTMRSEASKAGQLIVTHNINDILGCVSLAKKLPTPHRQ